MNKKQKAILIRAANSHAIQFWSLVYQALLKLPRDEFSNDVVHKMLHLEKELSIRGYLPKHVIDELMSSQKEFK